MSRVFVAVLSATLVSYALSAELGAQRREFPQTPSANMVHAALAGRWAGSLRYRDYQDSTRFVSLPTLLVGTTSGDSSRVQLDFEYDDGPGKTVRSSDTFALDAARKMLTWGETNGKRPPSQFAVTSLRGGPLSLIVEMDGEDDNRRARIRESITVTGTALRVLKEVRFSPDGIWLFRHEYRLSRTP